MGHAACGVSGACMCEGAASYALQTGSVNTISPPLRLPPTSLQELARADEAWQLRWATETARLQRLHGEELVAAAAKHRQVRVDEGPCCAGVQCAFADVSFSGWLVGDHCAAGRACLLAAPFFSHRTPIPALPFVRHKLRRTSGMRTRCAA